MTQKDKKLRRILREALEEIKDFGDLDVKPVEDQVLQQIQEYYKARRLSREEIRNIVDKPFRQEGGTYKVSRLIRSNLTKAIFQAQELKND